MHIYRTHKCDELRIANVEQTVKIAGWLQTVRDHGGVLFIDIRDHYGITQVMVPFEKETLRQEILKITKESTVSIEGIVVKRPDDTINEKIPTGEIEISAQKVEVLGVVSRGLPFEITSYNDTREELRLKYRFLDLRRKELHDNIVLRANIIKSIRRKMDELEFLEVQTPILTSSSPEGARDFIVPSRNHPGKFYALPQAPQQFKQLLMVSGFDKYFQIAPCFRDEDARADRSPGEFYQLDLEMAFSTQEDVFGILENLLPELFAEYSDWKISSAPFTRISYCESLLKYGTDKPDLRNPLLIYELTDVFQNSDFKAFKNKCVRAIPVSGCSNMPRSFFDKMGDFAIENGGKGLAWLTYSEDGELKGPIAKVIDSKSQDIIKDRLNITFGDTIFFIADAATNEAVRLAGLVRTEIANRLDIIEKDVYKFCWIVDFPMFELNDDKKIEFSHNPFSMPQGEMKALTEMKPLDIIAYQYDIICNGYELSSGAVRNHDPEIMLKAFDIAGYNEDTVKSKFPALFEAFHYGAPPHAGIAPGLDRIVMLLAHEKNIREVIAFPMNSRAQDVLMGAPGEVDPIQLREVHIKAIVKESPKS